MVSNREMSVRSRRCPAKLNSQAVSDFCATKKRTKPAVNSVGETSGSSGPEPRWGRFAKVALRRADRRIKNKRLLGSPEFRFALRSGSQPYL